MHIVIESGLMYTVSVVIVFVVFLASNNAQYAVSDCVSLPLHLCEVSRVSIDLIRLLGSPNHRKLPAPFCDVSRVAKCLISAL